MTHDVNTGATFAPDMVASLVLSMLSVPALVTAQTPAPDERATGANGIYYSNRASYPISVEPFITAGIAFGDVDGDSDLDMIEANGRHWPQANYVYFHANNGGLAMRTQLDEHERTGYTVKLADLDGDGDLDVVQAFDRQANQVYFNDGAGLFGAAHLFGSIGSNTRSIEIADLDGDGALDIVEVCGGTPNLIFLNGGDGSFASHPIAFGDLPDGTLSVKVADMNDEGYVDLVLANRDQQQNKSLLGDGNMRFETTIPFGSGVDDTRGLVLVGMNGDDRMNIVAANIGEANSVMSNMDDGAFTLIQHFGDEAGRSYAILADDLDGDGDPDIIIGNVAGLNRVFLNDGTGYLSLLADPPPMVVPVLMRELHSY